MVPQNQGKTNKNYRRSTIISCEKGLKSRGKQLVSHMRQGYFNTLKINFFVDVLNQHILEL